jgi:hypothetical protein
MLTIREAAEGGKMITAMNFGTPSCAACSGPGPEHVLVTTSSTAEVVRPDGPKREY